MENVPEKIAALTMIHKQLQLGKSIAAVERYVLHKKDKNFTINFEEFFKALRIAKERGHPFQEIIFGRLDYLQSKDFNWILEFYPDEENDFWCPSEDDDRFHTYRYPVAEKA